MNRLSLAISLIAAAGFCVLLVLTPLAAAAGWLIAFVGVGAAPIGALAWRLIGRLTGGAWAEAPALKGLSTIVFGVLVAAIPLLAVLGLVYPWAKVAQPLTAYLAPLGFGFCTLLTLGGLSAVAWLVTRVKTRLFAGLALLFYGVTVGLAATDWLFSLQPAFISSNGGMALAVQQLGTALAAVLLLGAGDDRQRRDLMGLLVATLLGALYLDLMAYIVVWYGDQADKTAFYRLRGVEPWPLVMAVIVLAGRLAPIGLIALHRRVDRSGRAAAYLALLGFWLETVWLVSPSAGLVSIAAGALASVACVVAFLAWPPRRPGVEALAHG